MKKILFISLVLGLSALHAQWANGSKKFLGNITTNYEIRADFGQYWNQITGENECKWSSIENSRDQMNWTGCDRVNDYAKANNIPHKFHTLIWGSQYPTWMDGLNTDQQREELIEWLDAVQTRYPDLKIIDVVNEAIASHAPAPFKNALGGDGATGFDWIIESFRLARERWPNAVLVYNDYNVLSWNTNEFIELMQAIKPSGYVDAMGFQAHGLNNYTGAQLQSTMQRIYDAVQLPIYISEYDIGMADDNAQKNKIADQFPVFWEADYVAGVTLWGYVVGATWVDDTGLIRADGTERPAFTWIKDYIAQNLGVDSPTDWSNGSPTTGPVFTTSPDINLEENNTVITTLAIKDDNNASFSITGGADASKFVLNGSQISFTQSPVFATPTDDNLDNIYEVDITATSNGQTETISLAITVTQIQAPYTGLAIVIPGTIEAEDYDLGGAGKAYNDLDIGNEGAAYRDDDVDITANDVGGYSVGWTEAGEWLAYTVDVQEAKSYEWSARVAAGVDNASFRVYANDQDITGLVEVPNGGDWDTYAVISGQTTPLTSGEQVIRLEIEGSYVNIDWIQIGAESEDDSITYAFESSNMNAAPLLLNNMSSNDFKINSSGSFEFQVINTKGVVLETGESQHQTSLGSSLTAGVYLLKIRANNNITTHKIIKF